MITRLWQRFCLSIVRTGNSEIAKQIDAEVERQERERTNLHPLFKSSA